MSPRLGWVSYAESFLFGFLILEYCFVFVSAFDFVLVESVAVSNKHFVPYSLLISCINVTDEWLG